MSVIKNIMTFGAVGRVENKLEEFNNLKEEYQIQYNQMEEHREKVNEILEELIRVKVDCVTSLKNISKISSKLRGKDRGLLYRNMADDIELFNFESIDKTISVADMAIRLTAGVSSGVSTAVGAWALVSTFGSASTGTAIAGLSGVAASNATLAWFGGGALAAGGGGIVAGTGVLAGIVVIPALALTGILSHLKANKQISEIGNNMNEILNRIDTIQSNIFQLNILEERSKELIESLNKARYVFDSEVQAIYKQVYPSIFAKVWKMFRKKILRRNYFSKEDIKNIAYIGGLASDFATLIETKPIEN